VPRFTTEQTARLTELLRRGGHADKARRILTRLGPLVSSHPRTKAADKASREARRRELASLPRKMRKSVRRWIREGDPDIEMEFGKPERRGRTSLDRDFAKEVTLFLVIFGIRIGRGYDTQFRWLEDFLSELCEMAGATHPNISRVLELAAKDPVSLLYD
jgi:hypothetical protein